MPVVLSHVVNSGSVSLVKNPLTSGISARIWLAVSCMAWVFIAIPLMSWSPVFVPDKLPKFVMSPAIILLAWLLVNTGSASVIPPAILSAVLACKA